jgi:hypothetical protein
MSFRFQPSSIWKIFSRFRDVLCQCPFAWSPIIQKHCIVALFSKEFRGIIVRSVLSTWTVVPIASWYFGSNPPGREKYSGLQAGFLVIFELVAPSAGSR